MRRSGGGGGSGRGRGAWRRHDWSASHHSRLAAGRDSGDPMEAACSEGRPGHALITMLQLTGKRSPQPTRCRTPAGQPSWAGVRELQGRVDARKTSHTAREEHVLHVCAAHARAPIARLPSLCLPACSMSSALLVFVRHPTPGAVKTRLAAGVGPDHAALFYRHCAERIVAQAARQARCQPLLVVCSGFALWGCAPSTCARSRALPPPPSPQRARRHCAGVLCGGGGRARCAAVAAAAWAAGACARAGRVRNGRTAFLARTHALTTPPSPPRARLRCRQTCSSCRSCSTWI